MTKIFISYRRQDTKQIAGRIFDRLTAKFPGEVFMDVEGIPFGVNFHGYLNDEVADAQIVLALIGHGWADAKDGAGRRRLDDPDDFVRIEIEAAIRLKKLLGAVLIDGAAMPLAGELPDSLRSLTRQNAAFVDAGKDFHPHMDRLIGDLERHLNGQMGNGGGSRPSAPAVPVRPDYRTEGRIEVDAAIVHNAHDGWFLPGAGKTEWFQDIDGGPEMVVVPAGSFMMGSPAGLLGEPERLDWEGPQHKVTIGKPFAIGRHAITRGQFAAFVNATGHNAGEDWRNPGVAQDDGHPVVCVSWDDAQAYAKWLSQKTGKGYRLLSEAEWEYVCRAGTVTPFWWGTSITPEQANYDGTGDVYKDGGQKGEYRKKTVPVNSFQPNPWGLYQVHGNVWEWCEDVWHDNYEGAPTDGSAWLEKGGAWRALRGGSWNVGARDVRAASRSAGARSNRVIRYGFRCARVLAQAGR